MSESLLLMMGWMSDGLCQESREVMGGGTFYSVRGKKKKIVPTQKIGCGCYTW